MFRQAFVFFFIALEVLLGAPLHPAGDMEFIIIFSLNQKEPLSMRDHLRVDGVARRVTEREEVDGIQHVGLTHTILSDQTVDLG